MTPEIQQSAVRNRLLRAMTQHDFNTLAPDLHLIDLAFGGVIETQGEPIEEVVFIESGIASRLVVGKKDELAESGHIGFEGMTRRQVVLGGSMATNRIQMQIVGKGLSIRASLLVAASESSPSLRHLLTRYALTCEMQTEYTLLAATNLTISERLARWLLMYHDRVEGDDFPVTHNLLATMLNVRRAGITGALHILEGHHAIRSTRGSIHVSDRAKLEKLAAGSYGVPEAYYEQMITTGVEDVALVFS